MNYQLASKLNTTIEQLCRMIITYSKYHEGDEYFFHHTWYYDGKNEQFIIEIETQWQENVSCHCHPEWHTTDHKSKHELPKELMDTFLATDYTEDGYDDFENYIYEAFEEFIKGTELD